MVDLEALRRAGDFEARQLSLIEGACRNALNYRMKILCELSAEAGEWSSGEDLAGYCEGYCGMMRAAESASKELEHSEKVLFAAMSACAREMGEVEELPWNGDR